MADTKISELTALSSLAVGDLLVVVDVSDASMGSGGTDKKVTLADAKTFMSDDPLTTGRRVTALSKTANYTVTAAEEMILCSASGGAFTVTIPAASSHTGRVIRVKKTDSSTNQVTVARTGSNTLEGATSFGLRSQYAEVMLASDGSNWHVIEFRPGLPSAVLPSAAFDGQIHHYLADSTNGIVWQLVYRSAEATYKWLYVGGPAMRHEILTSEVRSSTTFADITTVGPTLTAPFAGDYEIRGGCQGWNGATGNSTGQAAVKLGSAATSGNEDVFRVTHMGDASATVKRAGPGHRTMIRTLAASDVVKIQYLSSAGSWEFYHRWLMLTPVWVV